MRLWHVWQDKQSHRLSEWTFPADTIKRVRYAESHTFLLSDSLYMFTHLISHPDHSDNIKVFQPSFHSNLSILVLLLLLFNRCIFIHKFSVKTKIVSRCQIWIRMDQIGIKMYCVNVNSLTYKIIVKGVVLLFCSCNDLFKN